jgi:polysaccharide deacetylase family protein (PEP-CTERM system associated)
MLTLNSQEMAAGVAGQPRQHVLTIALEDYFQVGAFNWLIQRGQWYRFESRLEVNTRRTLDMLARYNLKATFFVLGWIADAYPELVRTVAAEGHEIASKGYYHRSIRDMSPEEFREDLARSREALERASQSAVRGYRVADEWFEPRDLWALDVLAEEGYAYDSSICPQGRTYAHEPWRRFIHQHKVGVSGKSLWEFPLSTAHLVAWDLPIAGGNYFRQFPQLLMRRWVRQWERRQPNPFVMYFHVWELDPEQPRLNAAGLLTRIRHYRNLDRMQDILEYYFARMPFTSIANYLQLPAAPVTEPRPVTGIHRPEVIRRPAVRFKATETPVDLTLPTITARVREPVTVVIPCFNEELIIPYLMNTLDQVVDHLSDTYDVRLLFVDDCSQDGTYTALADVCRERPNARVVHHERNQGVAGAIATGLANATTEIVCSIDCDCTYDPHELRHMIPLLDGADMVTASPYHPEGMVRNVAGWRLWLSMSASWLYRVVLKSPLSTYTSCFRVYRRSTVTQVPVKNTRFLGIAELLAMLHLAGGKVVEYPAVLEVRMLGRSKMKVVRTIVAHLRMLAKLLVHRMRGVAPLRREGDQKETTKVVPNPVEEVSSRP